MPSPAAPLPTGCPCPCRLRAATQGRSVLAGGQVTRWPSPNRHRQDFPEPTCMMPLNRSVSISNGRVFSGTCAAWSELPSMNCARGGRGAGPGLAPRRVRARPGTQTVPYTPGVACARARTHGLPHRARRGGCRRGAPSAVSGQINTNRPPRAARTHLHALQDWVPRGDGGALRLERRTRRRCSRLTGMRLRPVVTCALQDGAGRRERGDLHQQVRLRPRAGECRRRHPERLVCVTKLPPGRCMRGRLLLGGTAGNAGRVALRPRCSQE
jgi:hypothetical protein